MNKVILVGRLGQDPEVKTSKNDKKFAKFSLATNDGFRENKKTNWHSCIAFGKSAEIIEKFVFKGSELALSGSIEYSEHEDKYYTNILVNDFTFIGGKKENNTDQAFEPARNLNEDHDNLPF